MFVAAGVATKNLMAMQNGVPLITTSAGAKVRLPRSSRRHRAASQPACCLRGGAQGMKYEETWGGFKIGDSTEVRRGTHREALLCGSASHHMACGVHWSGTP